MDKLRGSPEYQNRWPHKLTDYMPMTQFCVTLMSTSTQPGEIGSVMCRQKDGTCTSVPCPKSIIDYNTYMGGVDRGDQLRGYYSCRSKSRKFYKYIYHFLLDVTITNVYILHRNHSHSPSLSVKEFCLQLAKELVGNYCSCRFQVGLEIELHH